MAVLLDADRADLAAEFMRELSSRGVLLGCDKPAVRAMLNGADQFCSDNAVAMNLAIPQPARGACSAAVKAEAYKFVMTKRWQKGA